MNNVVDELDNMLNNLSLNQLDDVINRMENMKINSSRDSDVEGLIGAMSSLSTVPGNKKLEVALEGVKQHKKRVFAKKYKSISGRKTKISSKQMDDIFATMNALKGDDDDESIDMDDLMAELDQVAGGKKKRVVKKKPVKKSTKKPVKKSTKKQENK